MSRPTTARKASRSARCTSTARAVAARAASTPSTPPPATSASTTRRDAVLRTRAEIICSLSSADRPRIHRQSGGRSGGPSALLSGVRAGNLPGVRAVGLDDVAGLVAGRAGAGGVPRVVASGNFATPLTLLRAVDAALPAYRLNLLN